MEGGIKRKKPPRWEHAVAFSSDQRRLLFGTHRPAHRGVSPLGTVGISCLVAGPNGAALACSLHDRAAWGLNQGMHTASWSARMPLPYLGQLKPNTALTPPASAIKRSGEPGIASKAPPTWHTKQHLAGVFCGAWSKRCHREIQGPLDSGLRFLGEQHRLPRVFKLSAALVGPRQWVGFSPVVADEKIARDAPAHYWTRLAYLPIVCACRI